MKNKTGPREDEAPKHEAKGDPGTLVTVDERYAYRIYSGLNPAVRLIKMIEPDTPNDLYEVRLFNAVNERVCEWRFTERTADGYYLILSQTEKLLALGEATNDTAIVSPLTRRPAQYWRLIDAGSGYYYFENKYDNWVLDVEGGNSGERTRIITYPRRGGANQKFKLARIGA